ncbi:cell wall-active antibiotics response protein LiaF [Paenibacillus sp. KS-LC4]|uniref:cell wall-active antibiotics response protein LiaF n=1 Tax=Paenibacillus sp. KS-LC4 TaxID=2979727 RepID=UPI0030CADA81
MNGSFFNRFITAGIVIAIGVVFFLNQTGIISTQLSIGEIISNFWPLILIVIGLKGVCSKDAHRHGGGFWVMIIIGAVFLARNMGWSNWSIGDIMPYIWPIIIILVGINMLRKPSRKRRKQHEPPTEDWKSYDGYGDGDVPPAPPLHPGPTDPFAPKINLEKERTIDSVWKEQAKQHYRDQRKEWKNEKNHYSGKSEWWNNDPNVQTRSNFIGDIHIGHDHWELQPINISHFIGDTVIDLTKAQIAYGETKITVSSFIGDVKVYVPNDYEVGIHVQSSVFIGDVKFLGKKEQGMFKSMDMASPSYAEADKKIKLVVSSFIGDVRVTRVG